MVDDFLIVIMGATGDLSLKKLFPAIYGLLRLNKIGGNFGIIAVARKPYTQDEFFDLAKVNIKTSNNSLLEFLKSKVYYFSMDFNDKNAYEKLRKVILEKESENNTKGNRLFYLATLPEHFSSIVKNLKANSLTDQNKGWCRVVFEKPFGEDEKTAMELNREISKAFDEKQIFRIDHYLGKELVKSLVVLRSANVFFGTLWSSKHVDHVQINLLEDFGIGKRGNYYDKYGALKDVFQNHVLQLLSLVSMELPQNMDAKCIRDEKVKALKKVAVEKEDVVLGQYKGYCSEEGVRKDSKTETFFAARLFVKNNTWHGTPFYVRSGKNLKHKFSSIYIQFKNSEKNFLESEIKPNYLLIQIQPESGILLCINTRSPHDKNSISQVKMTFCHECTYGPNTLEAYESLIKDCLEGDQSAFIRQDEVEASWKIVDKIKEMKLPVHEYDKNTFGPRQADELIRKDKREWFNRIESVIQNINF